LSFYSHNETSLAMAGPALRRFQSAPPPPTSCLNSAFRASAVYTVLRTCETLRERNRLSIVDNDLDC